MCVWINETALTYFQIKFCKSLDFSIIPDEKFVYSTRHVELMWMSQKWAGITQKVADFGEITSEHV